jgi:hypothetical protein
LSAICPIRREDTMSNLTILLAMRTEGVSDKLHVHTRQQLQSPGFHS